MPTCCPPARRPGPPWRGSVLWREQTRHADDGASSWRILTRVMLPLVRNGVVVVLITNFIAAWGEWLLANILTNDQDKRTFPVVIAGAFGGMGQWQWPNIAAVYIVGIMPGLIIFALTQRWYTKGLQEGALKG
jgi:multiple sugar transport system permease protein